MKIVKYRIYPHLIPLRGSIEKYENIKCINVLRDACISLWSINVSLSFFCRFQLRIPTLQMQRTVFSFKISFGLVKSFRWTHFGPALGLLFELLHVCYRWRCSALPQNSSSTASPNWQLLRMVRTATTTRTHPGQDPDCLWSVLQMCCLYAGVDIMARKNNLSPLLELKKSFLLRL